MTVLTVILPHKRNPGNDKALQVALDCLFTNTVNDFKLIIDAAYNEPLYERINRMVAQADTEYCVYTASDTFMSPGWDVPMLAAVNNHTFVTGVLVEPGVISIFNDNVGWDFGRRPETFRRDEFEQWCFDHAPSLNLSPRGWYAPYMFPRVQWLEFGGYNTELVSEDGFTGADQDLFEAWEKMHMDIVRVRSYAYHLQRYSDEAEQVKQGR